MPNRVVIKSAFLISLESTIKSEIMGQENSIKVVIAGSEVLLSSFGINISKEIKKIHKNAQFIFDVVEHETLISNLKQKI